MSSKDWKVSFLEEIIDIEMGQSPKSEFYNTTGEGLPFLQGNRTFGEKFPTFDTWCTQNTKLARKGDVIMSVRAPVGDLNLAPTDLSLGRGVCAMRLKLSSDNEYLFYLLKHNINELINRESGTVFGSVNKKDILGLKVLVPENQMEQKAIAHVLSTLDDKIEVNNRINKTLENMAQAIFKRWFVDFEFPNEEGEPYKSNGGEMVESELGMIPKGWEVVELETIINVKHGYAFKSEFFSDNPTNKVLLTPGNFNIGGGFKADKLKYYSESAVYPSNYVLKKEDLLVTMTDLSIAGDTLGYPLIVPRRKYIMLHNQRLGKVEIKKNSISKEYLYYLFCTKEYRGYILGSATGTTVKHTAPNRIMNYRVALPNWNVLSAFSSVASEILEMLSENDFQNVVLKSVRDTLLPKLMAGEIRVPIEES